MYQKYFTYKCTSVINKQITLCANDESVEHYEEESE